jgi:hypothetical protein
MMAAALSHELFVVVAFFRSFASSSSLLFESDFKKSFQNPEIQKSRTKSRLPPPHATNNDIVHRSPPWVSLLPNEGK